MPSSVARSRSVSANEARTNQDTTPNRHAITAGRSLPVALREVLRRVGERLFAGRLEVRSRVLVVLVLRPRVQHHVGLLLEAVALRAADLVAARLLLGDEL